MIQDSGIKPKLKEFRDLLVWQEGYKLVILVYATTKLFPKQEVYSLKSKSFLNPKS